MVHAIEKAIHVIGGRWRTILMYLLLGGPRRFTDLVRETKISHRMLTVNLRALEEAGLIVRIAYPEVPPRVEYALTPEGMELRPLINDLRSWGQKFEDRQKLSSIEVSISSPAE